MRAKSLFNSSMCPFCSLFNGLMISLSVWHFDLQQISTPYPVTFYPVSSVTCIELFLVVWHFNVSKNVSSLGLETQKSLNNFLNQAVDVLVLGVTALFSFHVGQTLESPITIYHYNNNRASIAPWGRDFRGAGVGQSAVTVCATLNRKVYL